MAQKWSRDDHYNVDHCTIDVMFSECAGPIWEHLLNKCQNYLISLKSLLWHHEVKTAENGSEMESGWPLLGGYLHDEHDILEVSSVHMGTSCEQILKLSGYIQVSVM
jgi:hypothetical protein